MDISNVSITKADLQSISSEDFNQIYESVEFIPLETTDSSLFASVSQAIVLDDAIIVRARFSATSDDSRILQFKKDGSFIRQIGTIGKGPGEYLSIDQIVVANDTIYAFDEWNRCMHVYSALDGNYLYSTPKDSYNELQGINTAILNPINQDFIFTSDVIFGQDRYSLGTGNPSSGKFEKLIDPKFSVNGWISYGYGYPTLCNFNSEKALFILPLDNTIYSFDYKSGDIQSAFNIFPEQKMPEFEQMEEYESARQKAFDKKIPLATSLFATKDYVIVSFVSGSIVWNIPSNAGYFTLNGWKEGAKEFPFFPPFIVGTVLKDNTFICAYDSSDVMEYCESIPSGDRFRPTDELLSSLSEDSNQVLILFKLKTN